MIVVIPIYKVYPSETEIISLKRCMQVLNGRKMSLCTYAGLDISWYEEMLQRANVQYSVDCFDSNYFRSTDGYNELMLTAEFYHHFHDYEYMLIYQPDAYIFEDRLQEWMSKGYDYVGAPWVTRESNGKLRLGGVGNGGFCLKKIKWFEGELQSVWPVLGWNELCKRFRPRTLKDYCIQVLRLLGYQNNIGYLFTHSYQRNEDTLCHYIAQYSWRHKPKIPTPEDALQFSFECEPSTLYEMNDKRLPVGCHAWEKYEYETFWKQHIQ